MLGFALAGEHRDIDGYGSFARVQTEGLFAGSEGTALRPFIRIGVRSDPGCPGGGTLLSENFEIKATGPGSGNLGLGIRARLTHGISVDARVRHDSIGLDRQHLWSGRFAIGIKL